MEMPISRRWEAYPKISDEAAAQLQDFKPFYRQLLFNRGLATLEEAEAFLNGRTIDNADPFLIKDMALAVERLHAAVAGGEPVAVYGDYDVDGVTATVLLVELLRAAGGDVEPYIPNRFDEGYGLNNDALDALHKRGVRLVITVDCGVRSPHEAAHAHELGLDMIITDHHQPGPELPAALAVINPRQAGDTYAFKDLAGVGLAFKLAQAYLQSYPIPGVGVEVWLDLVALGTVADLAPLRGENRQLVSAGITKMRAGFTRQGILSLANSAEITPGKLNAMTIGFTLAPRLNAAGRLESALDAYHLLISTNPAEAGMLAQKLSASNSERQLITRQIQAQAIELAFKGEPDPMLLVAVDPEFNEGVVGLAAARLVEAFYRPAIVARRGPDSTRASCRSIPEFHITAALDTCADLLVKHGGHKVAAGFTVLNENFDLLVTRLRALAVEQLAGKDLRPCLFYDFDLPLNHLTFEKEKEVMGFVQRLQPFGMGNPEPYFVSRSLKVSKAKTMGRDNSHLKLTVAGPAGRTFEAIAFRQGHWLAQNLEQVDLLYTLEYNEFNGNTSLQLNVKDIKPVGFS
jgi:single-stranded-DNA-specific exonuclease